MNQKNIFTALAIIQLISGVIAYFSGGILANDTYPGISELGVFAITINMEVVAVTNIMLAIVLFASREKPEVVWAFTLGFILLGINSLKHRYIDGVDVPLLAIAFQFAYAVAFGFLLAKKSLMASEVSHKKAVA